MTMTNEEVLELAKKCGAFIDKYDHSIEFSPETFATYNSALEEKHQAAMAEKDAEIARLGKHLKAANDQAELFERKWYLCTDELEKANATISMLVDGLQEYGRHKYSCDALTKESGLVGNKCDCGLENLLKSTKAASDAFIAEVKAGALEEAANKIFVPENGWGEWSIQHAHRDLLELAAELRNQAQAEGKEEK